MKKINVKIENNNHVLSLNYFDEKKKYELDFNYLIDIQKNLDVLREIKFEKISQLSLSNIKLKKIDFLLNPTLHNLRDLKLDSNDIEDISILSNNNLKIFEVDDMSIKQNPIKKGLNALKGAFFARSFDISLKIDKAGEEYKISVDFNYPNIYIDFFINNINDLKNYLDFEKCNI